MLVSSVTCFGRFLTKEDLTRYEKECLAEISSGKIELIKKSFRTIESLDLNTKKIRCSLYVLAFSNIKKKEGLDVENDLIIKFAAATTLGKIMGFRLNSKPVEIKDKEALISLKNWLDKKLALEEVEVQK